MKLLLFSDLHCDEAAATRLVAMSCDVDVLIGAGDFATCRRDLHKVIDILKTVDKPTVLVPGNAESIEELQAACAGWSSAHPLHGNGVEIDGVDFFGLGGAVPVTPFGSWSYDFTEEQGAALLADCPTGGVLVSHSPPKGLCDIDSHGRPFGSEAVLATLDAMKPRLVVCGHVHASWGCRETRGETTVINAGPTGVLCELTGAPHSPVRFHDV